MVLESILSKSEIHLKKIIINLYYKPIYISQWHSVANNEKSWVTGYLCFSEIQIKTSEK